MKKLLLVLAALAFAVPAYAVPPTAEQQGRFYEACTINGAPDLCRCKADAVMTLLDTEFIEVVIASIKGKDVEAKYYDAYNDYIARSTEACGMGTAM
jgi:hypothetical protein